MKNKILCFLIAMGFANSLYAASILDIDFPQSGEEIVLTDSEVNNFSLTKHGFTPKGTSTAERYLRGDGIWSSPEVGVSAYILADSGTGTGNIFTSATLAGQGTLTATLNSNGVNISPDEVGYLDAVTGNIQTQLTGKQNTLSNSAGLAAALSDETGTNTVVFSSGSTQANVTLTGNSNFPSGVWNSSGSVGIGTTTPLLGLSVVSGSTTTPNGGIQVTGVNNIGYGGVNIDSVGRTTFYSGTGSAFGSFSLTNNGLIHNIAAYTGSGVLKGFSGYTFKGANSNCYLDFNKTSTYIGLDFILGADNSTTYPSTWRFKPLSTSEGALTASSGRQTWMEISPTINQSGSAGYTALAVYGTQTATGSGNNYLIDAGVGGISRFNLTSGGNVGIGTTTPNNILTLPISSATDPIADAWTVHCLSDYKDFGTETTEIIQLQSADIVKNSPVSIFKRKPFVAEAEIEKGLKSQYREQVKKISEKDMQDYRDATGVSSGNDESMTELINNLWDTKPDKAVLIATKVEAEKAKLLKLDKFQKDNYAIVAENAPPEAQVYDAQGNLQGVSPMALIGILWATVQKQQIAIEDLKARVIVLEAK